ncbi:Zinc finger CCCH domain-containing protein 25 [Apostasia shenzhenica]|uniref:Zinc finger CCCH domain-containing protein 25 n=1 Tax=Apostasia shenzhenica TaxID=1088818 RepID=A0A2I0AB35_9ASPA|nr:Zinc finger CCCH domain-containing protein 25 [Apostasia shenzhenica]
MNPLTLVKRIQKINSTEAALGISDEASWHAKYKDSAYIFIGGIPFDLTEGDLLAVFAQYGEVVDVNLVRDKATGKSKGFAFLAYEDQRSTILAVDNLNGAKVLGRIVRVDHVSSYKRKEEEDEETERSKRESRGVCHAFQRGECTRGSACKFSHDDQRHANTGWGAKDSELSRGHDKYEGPPKSHKSFFQPKARMDKAMPRSRDKEARYDDAQIDELYSRNDRKQSKLSSKRHDNVEKDAFLDRKRNDSRYKEDRETEEREKGRSARNGLEHRREDDIGNTRSDKRASHYWDSLSFQSESHRDDKDARDQQEPITNDKGFRRPKFGHNSGSDAVCRGSETHSRHDKESSGREDEGRDKRSRR